MSSPLTSGVAGSECKNNATCNGAPDLCCAYDNTMNFFNYVPSNGNCRATWNMSSGNSFTMQDYKVYRCL